MANTAGTNNGKDVIYIDVDDEITGIIEKVRGSHQKIVALVLPKRAAVLQSIVNMKLLKRSADEAKKNLVLITAEVGLLPLASTVGLHVAKSLQSKPEVPDSPHHEDSGPVSVDEDDDADMDGPSESDMDKTKTVGELAGAATVAHEVEEDDDTIDMGNEEESEDGGVPVVAGKKPTKGKDKKFKIPNFNKFRVLLVVGAVVIIGLIVGLYVCLTVLPKASVVIQTDSTAIISNTSLTLKNDTAAALDVKTGVVPSTVQQTQKTQTQQVPATGQQNNGVKATGNIKFYNCNQADTLSGTSHTIPAGTGVTANGHTFITSQDVTVQPSHFLGSACKNDVPSSTIGMTAQTGGAASNQSAANYSVAGYSSITGSGTDTTGGTDDITKVVTQADVDSAKAKISAQEVDPIKQTLKAALIAKGLYAIDATFNAGLPEVKTSSNPGDKADNVTVTEVITYTMLGVHEADLKKIVANDASSKIDSSKQSVLDYGLANAIFNLQSQDGNGAALTMSATVIAGPDLKVATIKTQVAGKKAGDASTAIKSNPGVTNVTVTYSPFWVSAIPKNVDKITVVIEKPQKTTTTNNAPATP